jgi:hypothetical protein
MIKIERNDDERQSPGRGISEAAAEFKKILDARGPFRNGRRIETNING